MAIRAAHYGETEDRLMGDPVVIHMLFGLNGVPRSELAHEDGTPRFEFMQAANRQYDTLGGDKTQQLHIGAVATTLLRLLKSCEDNDISIRPLGAKKEV